MQQKINKNKCVSGIVEGWRLCEKELSQTLGKKLLTTFILL
jgi:hypothetical protein